MLGRNPVGARLKESHRRQCLLQGAVRIPGFFFAVVLFLAFTACGQSPEPNGSTPPPPQTPTEAATQPPTAYPTPVLEVDASTPTSVATVASTSATPVPEVPYTDLHVAIRNGDAESVEHLLQTGADVNGRNRVGDTPLQEAFRQGNLEIMQLLVDAGADPYAEYPWGGETVFSDAIEEGNLEVVRILANSGTGPVGSVLPFAIVNGNDQVVRILLEAGADPDATDIGGRSSLDIAIILDKTEAVRMLADAGADVNEIPTGRVSVGGEDTILGMAVKSGNLEIIRILVDAGADVAAKSDPFGQSAMEIAVRGGNARTIEILKSAADRATTTPTDTPVPAGTAVPPAGLDEYLAICSETFDPDEYNSKQEFLAGMDTFIRRIEAVRPPPEVADFHNAVIAFQKAARQALEEAPPPEPGGPLTSWLIPALSSVDPEYELKVMAAIDAMDEDIADRLREAGCI